MPRLPGKAVERDGIRPGSGGSPAPSGAPEDYEGYRFGRRLHRLHVSRHREHPGDRRGRPLPERRHRGQFPIDDSCDPESIERIRADEPRSESTGNVKGCGGCGSALLPRAWRRSAIATSARARRASKAPRLPSPAPSPDRQAKGMATLRSPQRQPARSRAPPGLRPLRLGRAAGLSSAIYRGAGRSAAAQTRSDDPARGQPLSCSTGRLSPQLTMSASAHPGAHVPPPPPAPVAPPHPPPHPGVRPKHRNACLLARWRMPETTIARGHGPSCRGRRRACAHRASIRSGGSRSAQHGPGSRHGARPPRQEAGRRCRRRARGRSPTRKPEQQGSSQCGCDRARDSAALGRTRLGPCDQPSQPSVAPSPGQRSGPQARRRAWRARDAILRCEDGQPSLAHQIFEALIRHRCRASGAARSSSTAGIAIPAPTTSAASTTPGTVALPTGRRSHIRRSPCRADPYSGSSPLEPDRQRGCRFMNGQMREGSRRARIGGGTRRILPG